MSADRSASVLARLLNRSRSTGENYNLLLSRFAIERLLYRLSISPHAGRSALNGALLFALWGDTPHQPTKGAQLLGLGARTMRTHCEAYSPRKPERIRSDFQREPVRHTA